jgi:serine/threonine protein kinase
MKIPDITKRELLPIAAGVSKLSKVEFARNPCPALLKEPKEFWDEIFIANEAYMLEEITHPRIRRKLAYDATTHQLFLEYVEGTTLHDLVKAGATLKDPARTHHLLQSVAETAADMHAGILCDRPIVHNDLKSMNVLVPNAAPRETILIDFSHSYFENHLPPFIVDKKNNPAGTARYLAPEKWDADFTHGFKSDVFAFGVMAYFAYTGKHPFEGSVAEIEQQIRDATPKSPIELGSNVLRNTLAIVMSCLEKKPERRPSMEYVAKCYADAACLYVHSSTKRLPKSSSARSPAGR